MLLIVCSQSATCVHTCSDSEDDADSTSTRTRPAKRRRQEQSADAKASDPTTEDRDRPLVPSVAAKQGGSGAQLAATQELMACDADMQRQPAATG